MLALYKSSINPVIMKKHKSFLIIVEYLPITFLFQSRPAHLLRKKEGRVKGRNERRMDGVSGLCVCVHKEENRVMRLG